MNFVSEHMRILSTHTLNLVLAMDANQQNLSFASQTIEHKKQSTTELPPPLERGCLGTISDLNIFQQLLLCEDDKITIVVCAYDQSQVKLNHRFYLFESEKNSVIVYEGRKKMGELYIEDWQQLNKKLQGFLKVLNVQYSEDQPQDKQSESELVRSEAVRSKEEKFRRENNNKITEFKGVKNPPEKMLNYKNQIPIIVRKYNNVIQKISTSYPLTLQQEHALNLIMELELKGLISQNDGRVFKSYILQEDQEIFGVFMEYFEDLIDQIELARKLKSIKQKVVNYYLSKGRF